MEYTGLFAHDAYAEFLWVSSPDAVHSRNIARRPQVAMVIFDSHAPISTGQAVYISATAAQVATRDLAPAIETFSRRGVSHGGAARTVEDVQNASGMRLYRAVAETYSTLARDRQPDHRATRPARPAGDRVVGAEV